jgi:hypothetical protein
VTCTQDFVTWSVSFLLYIVLVCDVLDVTPKLPVMRIQTFLYQSKFSPSIISLPRILCYTYLVQIDTPKHIFVTVCILVESILHMTFLFGGVKHLNLFCTSM